MAYNRTAAQRLAATMLRERFAAEYLVDLCAADAYRRAHPRGASLTQRTCVVEGAKLLTLPDVLKLVQAGHRKAIQKTELTASRVLEEVRRIAFFDIADLHDANGRLLPIHKMSKEARSAVASIEVAQANFDRTDGKRSKEWLHKIRLESKLKGLELLAKHFKLLTEKIEDASSQDWERKVAMLRARRARPAP